MRRLIVLVALATLACEAERRPVTSPSVRRDAGAQAGDAGAPPGDAAATDDAAAPPLDGATGLDAGAALDGAAVLDATTTLDAGSVRDAGSVPDASAPDASVPPDRVLITWAEGGIPPNTDPYLIDSIQPLVDTLARTHAVDQSDMWPADTARYALIIWFNPCARVGGPTGIAPAIAASARAFVERGGRLLITGETNFAPYRGYAGQPSNEAIDRWLEAAGVPIRLDAPLAGAQTCGAITHPLMAGVSGLTHDLSNDLEVGAPGQYLRCSSDAASPLGCGEVVVMGDVFTITHYASSHERFIRNLVDTPAGCP
jgi:hypothetical protein